MRLDHAAIYDITGTNPANPANPANVKAGSTIEVWLSRRKPIGPEFCILVKLTRLDQNGNFQGEVIEPSGLQLQRVAGSFVDPDPDLHIIGPRRSGN